MASGGQGEQVEAVHAGRLHAGEVAEGAVDALGLLVDDQGAAALHVAAVPHLALAGADLLGVLHLGDKRRQDKSVCQDVCVCVCQGTNYGWA